MLVLRGCKLIRRPSDPPMRKKAEKHIRFTKEQRENVLCDVASIMSEASDPLCPYQYESYLILRSIMDISMKMMKKLEEKDLVKGARWEAYK